MQNLYKDRYLLLIGKNFLSHLNELTKINIKVYLSLSFLQKKREDYNDNEYNADTFT